MKKFMLVIITLAALLFTSATSITAHAASQIFKSPTSMQGRETIDWDKGVGCPGLSKVEIASLDGYGYDVCFFFTHGGTSASGYLGLGDPGGPGNIPQSFHLISQAAAPSGWIRYYNSKYPKGTNCKFSTGQYIKFQPFVYVTQIALNMPNSYHQCP